MSDTSWGKLEKVFCVLAIFLLSACWLAIPFTPIEAVVNPFGITTGIGFVFLLLFVLVREKQSAAPNLLIERILVLLCVAFVVAGILAAISFWGFNTSPSGYPIAVIYILSVTNALNLLASIVWVRGRRIARARGNFPRVAKRTVSTMVAILACALIPIISVSFSLQTPSLNLIYPILIGIEDVLVCLGIILVVRAYLKNAKAPPLQAGEQTPKTAPTPMTQEEEMQRNAQAAAQKVKDEERQKAKETARAKAEADKRRQAEEKAKRKAEEEARKRAEADEKLRRKAEQDAQKKAEYEAEMRRRVEAEAKAKAEAEAKRRAEEDARMKRLQDIIAVSDRLSVQRMAQLLDMPAEEVWKRVVDWAKQFNFRIAGDDIVFNKETVDAFVASLDAEFRKWGKDGKAQ